MIKKYLAASALAWSVLNLAGAVYALLQREPMHAMVHGVLALAFGVWAQRLLRDPAPRVEHINHDERVLMLQEEVTELRQKLSEAQEKLHFTEQLLGERAPAERVIPPGS